MPLYYVYDAQTGEVVHRHERYDVQRGENVECSQEEVLAVVDPALDKKNLKILETEMEPTFEDRGKGILRVNLEKQELVVDV